MSQPGYIQIRNTDTGELESLPLSDVADGQILMRSSGAVIGDSQASLTSHMADTPIHRRTFTKSLQFTSLAGSDQRLIFRTDKELTIGPIAVVLRGTTPSVTWNVRWALDLTGLQEAAFTGAGNQTTTSETIGDLLSPDTNPIPAAAWVWFVVASVGGTVDECCATLYLEETGN